MFLHLCLSTVCQLFANCFSAVLGRELLCNSFLCKQDLWGDYSSEDDGDVEEEEPERRSSFDASHSSAVSSSSKTALVSQDAFDALRSATVVASSPPNQSLPEIEELPPPPPVEGPKPVLQVRVLNRIQLCIGGWCMRKRGDRWVD